MKLLHWTLFVDLLGYQELNGDVDNLQKARELINFMNSNADIFEKQNNDHYLRDFYQNNDFNLYDHYRITFAFISDSLIVSYTPNLEIDFDEKTALLHSSNMLLILLHRLRLFIYKCVSEKKIFLRGGVSNHYSYIEGNFAVGRGVGAAYVAESRIAKHPRVVLACDVVENTALMSSINELSHKMYNTSLIVNDNGTYYLDFNRFGQVTLDANSNNPYVISNAESDPWKYQKNIQIWGSYLFAHKEAIEFQINKALSFKSLTDDDSTKLFSSLSAKYLWLGNYHNKSCIEFSNIKIALSDSFFYKNQNYQQVRSTIVMILNDISSFVVDESLLAQLEQQ